MFHLLRSLPTLDELLLFQHIQGTSLLIIFPGIRGGVQDNKFTRRHQPSFEVPLPRWPRIQEACIKTIHLQTITTPSIILIHLIPAHSRWSMLTHETGLFEHLLGNDTNLPTLIPTKYNHRPICDTKLEEIRNCEQQTTQNRDTTTQTKINNRNSGTNDPFLTLIFNPSKNYNSNGSSPDFTFPGDTVLPKITPVIPLDHNTLSTNPGQQSETNTPHHT